MKFEKITIELENFEAYDVIASSLEVDAPTVAPTQPTNNNDPYENDKW